MLTPASSDRGRMIRSSRKAETMKTYTTPTVVITLCG